MRGVLVLAAIAGFAASGPGLEQVAPQDDLLTLGIRQVAEGSFEEAVFTLDRAVQRLSSQPGRTGQLAEAYVHLGVAYVGLEHDAAARGKFREALRLDPSRQLDPGAFPARVLKVFEEERVRQTAEKKKRGARTFLVLGAVGAAGAAGAAAAFGGGPPSNRPPTASIGVTPQGQAITGVTSMTFAASAADPDGDALRYAWDFGDGGSGSGRETRHVFSSQGDFPVVLTVSDERGGAVTARTIVTARTLNGTWRNNTSCCMEGQGSVQLYYECAQTGSALDCRFVRATATGGANTRGNYVVRRYGTLTDPRHIELQVTWRFEPEPPLNCQGEVDPTLDSIRCFGNVPDLGRCGSAGTPACP